LSSIRRSFALALIFVLALTASLARPSDVFEWRIPPGWHLLDSAVAGNGSKVLILWQNVSPEDAYKGRFSSRLLIFDGSGRPVRDLAFGNPRFLTMTRDDRIILREGNESTSDMTVFDLSGRELFAMPTKWREVVPALLGKDIGLWVPNEPIGEPGTQPLSIIDGEDGREKVRFEAACPCSESTPFGACGFLPIGEGGFYLLAAGTSIFLRSYLQPGQDIWRIDDIGDRINGIWPFDRSRVLVSLNSVDSSDYEHFRFSFGVAVIEWRSGKVVFKWGSNDPRDSWGTYARLEGSDLYFPGYTSDSGLLVPRSPGTDGGWDMARARKCRPTNFLKDDHKTLDGRHLVRIDKNIIHIKQIEYEGIR